MESHSIDVMFLKSMLVMTVQCCEYTENHQILQVKYVDFTEIYKLYLNKAVQKEKQE